MFLVIGYLFLKLPHVHSQLQQGSPVYAGAALLGGSPVPRGHVVPLC